MGRIHSAHWTRGRNVKAANAKGGTAVLTSFIMINFFLLVIALRKCFFHWGHLVGYTAAFLLIDFVSSAEFWNSVHSAFAFDWLVQSGRVIDCPWAEYVMLVLSTSPPREVLIHATSTQNVCLVANHASWNTEPSEINVSVTNSYQIFLHPCRS